MIVLAAALPIRFAVLEEKHVGQSTLEASITRLSVKGADIRSDSAVPPLSNLKIWIPGIVGEAGEPAEIYAKVVAGTPEAGAGFAVRFTAMAPDVAAAIQRMR
jgi:hypothetical protein